MSLVGILSSSLFSALGSLSNHNSQASQVTANKQNGTSNFQQIQTEMQQLGQDLQTGNLTQAQQDFTTLSQNVSGANHTGAGPIAQAFGQLGKDLKSGNLQAAQADYTTIQQDMQLNAAQVAGHHHHHGATDSQNSSPTQQSDSVSQAISQLAQTLQAGNLNGAQQAFVTLQNDLQQIGGFLTYASNGASGTAAPAIASGLNVNA